MKETTICIRSKSCSTFSAFSLVESSKEQSKDTDITGDKTYSLASNSAVKAKCAPTQAKGCYYLLEVPKLVFGE